MGVLRPDGSRRRWAGLLAVVLSSACGGDGVTKPSSAIESLTLRRETPHFSVRAGGAGDVVVDEVADRLEAHYARVVTDLEVGSLRRVTVELWQDDASFYGEMERSLGQRYSSATGYVTGPETIRLLAVPQVARNAVHEFCHVASLYVNPAFGNNPRWLWETVAVFENGEFVDPRSLGYMAAGRYPTLAQLDADPNASRQVYEVGYTIGEFIVDRWGRPGLRRLIQRNGDTSAVLGLTPAAFQDEWSAFVRSRYLS